MRPRNPKRKDRWYLPKDHPFVRQGYVYERKEIAYLCVGSYRKSTNIPFLKSNKDFVLELLAKQIKDINYSSNLTVNTLTKAIDMFYKVNTKTSANRIYTIKRAVQTLINKDFYLYEIDQIRSHIIDNVKNNKHNYKQTTFSIYLGALSQVFTFLHSEGYILKNPINKNIFDMKPSEPNKFIFSPNELEQIFDAVKDKQEYLYFFKFLYLTGCRLREAHNLRWSDIKQDYIEIMGKGSKVRTIPLKPFPEIANLLEEIKSIKQTDKLFNLGVITYQNELKKQLLKLEIYAEGKGCHSFRKTRENELIHNKNFSAKIIAELLGHTEAVQRKHYLQTLQADELSEKLLKEIEINKNFAHEDHTKKDK